MATFERVGQFPELAREEFAAVEFNNRIIVAGGLDAGVNYLNDVWESADGVNWNRIATGNSSFLPAREGLSLVVHDNRLWVIGGYDGNNYLNDVWSSPDGRVWTRVDVSAASYTARDDGCVFSLGDRMYVVGGDNGTTFSDVWSSYDGTNWRQIVTSYDRVERTHVRPVVINNRMLLIGGADGAGTAVTTTSTSVDGVHWDINTSTNGLADVDHYGACVFDNKAVVIGGEDDDANIHNRVWYSPDGTNWKDGGACGFSHYNHEVVALKEPNRLFVLFGDDSSAVCGDVWMSYGHWQERDD